MAVKSDNNLGKEADDTNSRDAKVCKYSFVCLGGWTSSIEGNGKKQRERN